MKMNRREFLKTAGVLAAPMVISRIALAQNGVPGANERIGIAGIGVGRQGGAIFREAANNPRTEPICVADAYRARAEEVAKQTGCDAAYQDFRKVLERRDVDAILTATPDHWRSIVCVAACRAGKHLFGEKPISLTVADGRAMVTAAREAKIAFQTGSLQRSQRENFIACEWIRNGGLGEITSVTAANYESPWFGNLPAEPVPETLDWEMWCGPAGLLPFHHDLFTPRANPGWISFRPYSGGEMTGWGTHGLDQVQAALGMEQTGPVEIFVEGEPLKAPVYDQPESRERGNRLCSTPKLSFRYANGILVTLADSNRSGAIFHGTKGKMEIFRGRLASNPPELAEELLKNDPRPNDNHIDNWLRSILTGEPLRSEIEVGHRTASLCHLLNIARELGRNLTWDPAAERFPNDEQANALLSRQPRDGWKAENYL